MSTSTYRIYVGKYKIIDLNLHFFYLNYLDFYMIEWQPRETRRRGKPKTRWMEDGRNRGGF